MCKNNYLIQVIIKDINTRDFNADANRVRNWVQSYEFPENMRIEVDDDAPEEVKSMVSSMDSQKVSRAETPIENIPRTPSPKLDPPAPSTPITCSSSESDHDPAQHEQAAACSEMAQFQYGEILDPRVTVALSKIAVLEEGLEKSELKLERAEKREVEMRKKLELLELLENCPNEVKKTLRKELNENVTQVNNAIKALEIKLNEASKFHKGVKSAKLDLSSDEMVDWFKTKFRAELGILESKNKIKNWIQSDLNAYQVTLEALVFQIISFK